MLPGDAIDTARSRARALLGPTVADRPSGPAYVRYEDLYRQGDTVAVALARLTSPKVVTFPEGKFSCRDFNTGYLAGITIPNHCRGIVGSGRGTLGGSSGTVFTMEARSSTKNSSTYIPAQGSSTPVQLYVLKQANQTVPGVWQNFQVAGTDQGHIFGAFQVYETVAKNQFDNILISGWEGDAGSPPGETFGLAVSGHGGHVMTRVEVDGRREPDGEVFGATALTYQNSVGAIAKSCFTHHVRTANFAIFQSLNGYMKDCTSDALSAGSKGIGNGGMNLERTAGWVLSSPTLLGRPNKVHMTHSNDNWTFGRYGVNQGVTNGSLKVVTPSFNDLWGNRAFYIQSWTPYWNGDSMSTPPLVVKSDWRKHFPYKWAHGTVQDIG